LYFNRPEKIELSVFFDFLKSNDPRYFLLSKFIEYHDIKFPGLNVSKIIEMGFVDTPADKLAELMKDRSDLLQQIEKTKTVSFYFPLAKLFNENDRGFAITTQDVGIESPEFDQKVYRNCRNFTVSEQENKAIEALQKTIDSFNDLILLGLIPNDRMKWKFGGLNSLVQAMIFDPNSKMPLSLNPIVKRLRCYSNYFGESRHEASKEKIENVF
jgi:hypothetical protein